MKRLITIGLVLMLLFSIGSMSFADDHEQTYILHKIEMTNIRIDMMIDRAVLMAEIHPEDADEIIEDLINDTNELAWAMMDEAEEAGIIVVCELVPVEIAGQIVWIDPLVVVGS